MGYAHKWLPPNFRVSNNLTSWRGNALDIHNQMIASGLEATSDTGQLDIGSVAALPAYGSYAGYRIYQFSDGNALPILIKLEFTVGADTLNTDINYLGGGPSKNLFTRVTIGTATNGAGTFTSNTIQFSCPHGIMNGDNTSYETTSSIGSSFICYNESRGFFGIAYQVGGVRSGFTSYGTFVGSALTFMIQRLYDSAGVPNSSGFMVLYPPQSAENSTAGWDNYSRAQSQIKVFRSDGSISQPTLQQSRVTNHTSPSILGIDHPAAFNDMVSFDEMNCMAVTALNGLSPGQTIGVQYGPGLTQTMVSIGRETCHSFSSLLGQRHCALMLFE